MIDPVPVTVIGGYLGTGKTTLVNQMLRQADGARLAVLVNEFGQLPIDEDLIEARDDELISIAGGCICCSFGSDLTSALVKLADLRPRPDHIVIEASGVAMPGAIAQSISILRDHRVAGVCVLADCLNIRPLSEDEYIGDTIERQLGEADLIVLTKSDLVSATQLEALQAWLTGRWPATPQIVSKDGQVPSAVLLGHFPSEMSGRSQLHHDRAYDSVLLRPSGGIDGRDLARILLDPAHGIIRAKGYFQDLSGACRILQIAGQRSEITNAEANADPGVICIGLAGRLNKDKLRHLVR